jgi:hypothetical protein
VYIRPVAAERPLIGSAADDPAKLPSAAGDVPNALDHAVAGAWANPASRVGDCDGTSGPDESGLCGVGVAGIAAVVLHDMNSHRYWAHDVYGPGTLEHDVAHVTVTDYRDKPVLMAGGVEGDEILGVSGCCR